MYGLQGRTMYGLQGHTMYGTLKDAVVSLFPSNKIHTRAWNGVPW